MRQNSVRDVIIVGAGGLGREVREWLEDINEVSPRYKVVGFVDDDPSKHGKDIHGVRVLGGLDWLLDRDQLAVIVAIGAPSTKRRIVERLGHRDYPTVVHPMATVGRFVTLGVGSIVCPGVVITTDVAIGTFVALNFNLTIGHDARVGDYALLAPGIAISGYARISEGAELGAGAVVLPSVSIGEWAVVGSGAVVRTDVPANCTAVGVPAKVIKTRPPGWHLT
jgi:sugar O-acyltransferase (sialic acid O-acetyltransferase NeuD family)